MRKLLILTLFILGAIASKAQQDSILNPLSGPAINTADRLMQNTNSKLSIGGYGEINFYQPIIENTTSNSELDVQRFVLMLGYKFTDRAQIITEIEYEHVSEVYIEQAFFHYRFNDYINFRAGLMLIPMGIVNEFHEPTTFNGVIRPHLDKYIIPTTWREIGAGFTGRFQSASLKYQVYVTNGFNGYDGTAHITGKSGLRGGRQKGLESYMSSPTFSAKVDYYGIKGLKLGLATYLGKSQSNVYDGIDKNDDYLIAQADSTVVGIRMYGLNGTYSLKGLQLRGQYVLTSLSNTVQYNAATGSDAANRMIGYYGEISYNLFYGTRFKTQLIPFIRYEEYNTHQTVDAETSQNLLYNRTDITMGLGYKITPGLILKGDYQIYKNQDPSTQNTGQLNLGVGFWF